MRRQEATRPTFVDGLEMQRTLIIILEAPIENRAQGCSGVMGESKTRLRLR
jgi:hypothetical protein